jgi:multiple sugar transport system permease protein/putative aldouronate transport system permease protein
MVTYAPHFISTVVIVGILTQFFSPRIGVVNQLRELFGFEPIDFFGNPNYFWHLFVWSDVWQNIGFGCIIYLAALSGIDPTLHEAATIDGATKFQRIRHIDIPGIVPIAVILFILNMGNTLDIGFEKAYLMQNNLNLRTSEVIETYVYKVGLNSQVVNFSYAAAIGFFKSVVGLVLLVLFNRLARKVGETSLW